MVIKGDGKFAFDMAVINRPIVGWYADEDISPGEIPGTYECGTAGCIAGLMNIMAGINKKILWGNKGDIDSNCMSQPLLPLFFPHEISHHSVTPKMAARVIRRFLDTGKVYYVKPKPEPAGRW